MCNKDDYEERPSRLTTTILQYNQEVASSNYIYMWEVVGGLQKHTMPSNLAVAAASLGAVGRLTARGPAPTIPALDPDL